LSKEDMAECVEDAFRYGTLVLATTTYNMGIFPFMRDFIHNLTERNYQNRKIAFIENGTWAPACIKTMKSMLEGCKNLTFAEHNVTIRSALDEESTAGLDALADELCS
jgi:flavorubredoxin